MNQLGTPSWTGALAYTNSGNYANITLTNAFGTGLDTNAWVGYSPGAAAGVTGVNSNATVVSKWASGVVHAYNATYEKGKIWFTNTQLGIIDISPPCEGIAYANCLAIYNNWY